MAELVQAPDFLHGRAPRRRPIPFEPRDENYSTGILLDGLADAQIFSKPYRVSDVERRLSQMVAKAAAS